MPVINKRPLALKDLEDIWFFIAQDSVKNANRFIEEIEEKCGILSGFPCMGCLRDEIIQSLHNFPVVSYMIYYFPITNGIDIIRVVHASRDINNLL